MTIRTALLAVALSLCGMALSAQTTYINENWENVSNPSDTTTPLTATGLQTPATGWTMDRQFTAARAGAALSTRDWTVVNAIGSAFPDPAPVAAGTVWCQFRWSPSVTNYSVALISPSFDASTHTTITLSFLLQVDNFNSAGTDELFSVWYRDNTATTPTWVQAQSFPVTAGDTSYVVTPNIDLSVLGGINDFQIAFAQAGASSNAMDNTIIDNLSLVGTGTLTAAPAITSTAPATAAVGVLYTYTVTATGSPAPTFAQTGTLPAWLSWDGTDTLSGTPAAGDVGTVGPLTITATNGVAPDDTEVFSIVVSLPAPEIDVTDPVANPVTNGETFTVYGLYVGGPSLSGTFTVTNSGTATLNVTAINTANTNCTITITPTNALPWALASGGGFDTFLVDLAPAAAGAFSGSFSIVSNDGDEDPFVFNVNGNTQANNEAEIAIHRLPADTDIANNSTVNETNTGLASFNRTFSIRNEGSAQLTLSGAPVVVSVPDNVIVTITQPPSSLIAGSLGEANSEDFILGIAPIAAGAFSFTVTIVSNDADEGTFVFNYTGHTTTPSGGGGGGGGGKDGCSTSNGNSGWLVLFAALAGLGLALRLRRSRA